MNHSYDLSSFETVQSLFRQIEGDYILSEKDKPLILNLLEEYFFIKQNAAPSLITAKWAEISKLLDTLNMKVK